MGAVADWEARTRARGKPTFRILLFGREMKRGVGKSPTKWPFAFQWLGSMPDPRIGVHIKKTMSSSTALRWFLPGLTGAAKGWRRRQRKQKKMGASRPPRKIAWRQQRTREPFLLCIYWFLILLLFAWLCCFLHLFILFVCLCMHATRRFLLVVGCFCCSRCCLQPPLPSLPSFVSCCCCCCCCCVFPSKSSITLPSLPSSCPPAAAASPPHPRPRYYYYHFPTPPQDRGGAQTTCQLPSQAPPPRPNQSPSPP